MVSNWEQTGKIIKDTFALARKDKDLYVPPVLNLITSMLLLVAAFAVYLVGSAAGWGTIPLPFALLAFALLFLSYVASAFFAAALSWMTLEVIQGKDTHLGKGLARAFKKSGSLLIYAGISFIVMLIAGQLRKRDSEQHFVVAIIKSFFAGLLEEAWDIASHLLLPAIVLTDKNFGGAIKEMPQMVKNLPAVLVGGFAFDFVVGWIYMLEALFALLVAFLLGFSGIGILIAVGLFLVLMLATYVFYSFVKSVYFTMLYLELHPELKKR